MLRQWQGTHHLSSVSISLGLSAPTPSTTLRSLMWCLGSWMLGTKSLTMTASWGWWGWPSIPMRLMRTLQLCWRSVLWSSLVPRMYTSESLPQTKSMPRWSGTQPLVGIYLLRIVRRGLTCTSRARQFKYVWMGWIGLLPVRTSVWEVRGWVALEQLCQVCVLSLVRFLEKWVWSLHGPVHLQGTLSTWVCQALLMTNLENFLRMLGPLRLHGPLPLQGALSTQARQALLMSKLENFLRLLGPQQPGGECTQKVLFTSSITGDCPLQST